MIKKSKKNKNNLIMLNKFFFLLKNSTLYMKNSITKKIKKKNSDIPIRLYLILVIHAAPQAIPKIVDIINFK